MNIRCSSLDDLFACAPSVLDTQGVRVEVQADGGDDASEIGSAVHALAAHMIDNGGTFDVKAECARRALSEEQAETVAQHMSHAVRVWSEYGPLLTDPRTEIALEAIVSVEQDIRLSGTCDVLAPVGATGGIFIDWKTGFIDAGYKHQAFGYAYGIWDALGRPEKSEIVGIVAFLRHNYCRVVRYTPASLIEWERDLTRNVLGGGASKYVAGKHCLRCSLYSSCAARKEITAGTVQALALPKSVDPSDPHFKLLNHATRMLAGLTPENKDDPLLGTALSDLIFRIRLAEQAAADAKALIRSAVERVGSLPLVEGYELALRETEIRKLNPHRALPVLRQMLGEKGTLDSMKLSLPLALGAYAAKQKSGMGTKAAARQQLEAALQEAGAIEIVTQRRLEEREIETLKPSTTEGDDDEGLPEVSQLGELDAGAGGEPAGGGGKRQADRSGSEHGRDHREHGGHEPDSL